MERSHEWHLGWNARLAAGGDPLLLATAWRRVDAAGEASCGEATA